MQKGTRRSLFSLYLAYFADYVTWGVAIAFLGVYITTETSPFESLYWAPEVALGVAFAAFPVGEVLGSPILGDLSDWIGRKKVLIWGFWGSVFSMFLCAYSLWIGNFVVFLLAQLLVGFFSGKQAMAQAAIVESDSGSKSQKLAFLSVIGGVSWILGPFLGGLMMQEPFVSYGGYIWPSILAALIYLFSLVFTQWFFIDTYKPANPDLNTAKFLHSIGDVFTLAYKERLFSIFIVNLLGWYLLIVSLSNFLIDRFHLSDAQIGFYNSYFSLCFTIGGIIGTAWILHRFRAKNILFWSLIVGSTGLFLLYHSDRIVELWTYLAIPAITEAWIYPAYQTVLSDQTSEQNQGKIFGLVGATNGGCQFVASLILAGITSVQCILVAALLFLCSGALLPALIRKKKVC
ncbi:MAG: MFS transporter [Parachlamydiales bacterium]|nr:MFS transporter [Parachlamydiales bacterium]